MMPPGSARVITRAQVLGSAASTEVTMSTRVLSLLPLLSLLTCTAFGQNKRVDPAAKAEIPPFSVPLAKKGVTYQRFIVLGDHGTGRPDQKRLGAVMGQRAASDGCDLVLTTGDNFYSPGTYDTNVGQFYADYIGDYSGAFGAGAAVNGFFPLRCLSPNFCIDASLCLASSSVA